MLAIYLLDMSFKVMQKNLPHIHAMLKVNWTQLTNDEKLFVNDCIRASVLDIVKVEETNRLIDEGLWKNKNEIYKLTSLATSILSHKCSPRCLVMIDENKFVCRKPNYLKMNPPSGNTIEKNEILPNDLSLESLRELEKVGIIDQIEAIVFSFFKTILTLFRWS